ncbi:hypothetical protein FIU85_19285 [Roseovarius sp. THAF8]|nr:hypothetical protein FIU85_19285 [Roseovarius sp. THAF8]
MRPTPLVPAAPCSRALSPRAAQRLPQPLHSARTGAAPGPQPFRKSVSSRRAYIIPAPHSCGLHLRSCREYMCHAAPRPSDPCSLALFAGAAKSLPRRLHPAGTYAAPCLHPSRNLDARPSHSSCPNAAPLVRCLSLGRAACLHPAPPRTTAPCSRTLFARAAQRLPRSLHPAGTDAAPSLGAWHKLHALPSHCVDPSPRLLRCLPLRRAANKCPAPLVPAPRHAPPAHRKPLSVRAARPIPAPGMIDLRVRRAASPYPVAVALRTARRCIQCDRRRTCPVHAL